VANDIKTATTAKPTEDEEFLTKARERFSKAQTYWNERYLKAKDDLKFYAGDQWPDYAKRGRNVPGKERPTLTINRLPQFHNQIVNDYRQATIGLRAVPQGTEHIDTAKAYQGLFRQIEKQSFAQLAYIKALSDSSIAGLGYITVAADYIRDDSFLQDLMIKRVETPFRHFPDPEANGFFLEDAEFWFVVDKISNTKYDELYKAENRADFSGFDGEQDWRTGEETTIAQYWYFEYTPTTLYLFRDGSTSFKEDVDHDHPHFNKERDVVHDRAVKRKRLCWALIDGANVLERRKWPKPRIPIVPVWGNELWVDDKRTFQGFVHNAKDSCRMFNFLKSKEAETIGLAPIAPYIAEEGQLEGHTDEWNDAANTPKSVLPYKGVAIDGHLVGPPQRQGYEAPVAAIVQAAAHAADDMKATIGIYDASLGARSNEVSGKAIDARKREGDTATYNYVDNLSLSVGYVGLIVGELIPVYYDTQRTQRIIGDDGQTSTVVLNKKDANGKPVEGSPQVVDILHDLVLDTGPSFQTQREQTAQTLIDLSHNFPQLLELAGDIAVGAMNFQGAQEIAARLKRSIPPAIVGEDEDPETQLAAAKQTIAQGKEVVAKLTEEVGNLHQELTEAKIKLLNKEGEIGIKRDELVLRSKELDSKLADLAKAGKEGSDTVEGVATLAEGLLHIGSQMETMKDMLMELVAEEVKEPSANEAPEAIPGDDAPEAAPTQEGQENAA
jgi:hypothetical protein